MCCSFLCDRYIGFLTRCALSKPFPELSIINIVKAMSMAGGRISKELSAEVFGDGAQGDYLAYSGAPTTRPDSLRSMPFIAVTRSSGSGNQEHLRRQTRANHLLREELRSNPTLRQRFSVILRQDHDDWNIDSEAFQPAVCLGGAVRDRGYERVWDSREDGKLVAGQDTNRHVFACACSQGADRGSGISMLETVETVPASSSSFLGHTLFSLSSPSSSSLSCSSSVSITSSLFPEPPVSPPRVRQHPPLKCSQRAPFEDHEDIAYGLVKRWIAVRQGTSGGLSTVVAHVRIFPSSIETVPDTGCPIIRQMCLRQYDDHYMLAKSVVCRITLSPLPLDSSRFLVSHVV